MNKVRGNDKARLRGFHGFSLPNPRIPRNTAPKRSIKRVLPLPSDCYITFRYPAVPLRISK